MEISETQLRPDGTVTQTMRTVIRVGTHDGVFHADDVFAVAVLQAVYKDVIIVRSRLPEVLGRCDILVDVGGVYDPDTNKFDHHQKGRAGARPNGVLYSAFGLVWRKFGVHLCGGDQEVADMIDRRLVQHVDMLDNGQHMFEGPSNFPGTQQMSLSAALSLLNPRFDEVPNDFDAGFQAALVFADYVLDRLIQASLGETRARSEVREACLAAKDSAIVLLPRFVPWQQAVHEFASPNALYVVFPSETGTWMVQTIPTAPGSFNARKPLPAAWAGLREQEFRDAVGLSDAVFCHPGRFICGAHSQASALQLAFMAAGQE